jgi:hypothetical protein
MTNAGAIPARFPTFTRRPHDACTAGEPDNVTGPDNLFLLVAAIKRTTPTRVVRFFDTRSRMPPELTPDTTDVETPAPPTGEGAAQVNTAIRAASNAPADAPTTYEDLIAGLDETQRQIVDGHIAGLRTALQAERAAVKRLEAKTKEAQAQAEAQAKATQADAEAATRRAAFYETALAQGVRRTSVRLAYVAAQDAGHVHEDGTVDWDALRDQFGDLFDGRTGPVSPARSTSAAAGAGTRTDTPATPSINQIIRAAAGRR